MKRSFFFLGAALALTTAYGQNGVPLWTNRYGLSNTTEIANALAVDKSGNVFVTGYTWGDNWPDYLTVGYSSTGVLLWTNRYDGPGASSDQASAVVVDGSGNVILTGFSYGTNCGYDYATIKLSGAGAPLWTNRYRGPNCGDYFALRVGVDGSDNVFVAGLSGFYDPFYATLAYSSSGAPLWTNRYRGIEGDYQMAVENSGNVLVTGAGLGIGSEFAIATIKYSGAGVALWTNGYNRTGSGDATARAIAVDGSGNVFVAGYDGSYLTLAYSSAGVPLWTNRCNGASVSAMAVDRQGTVIVTGSSWGTNNYDYATVAYSSAGVPRWTNFYNGPANGSDVATSVCVDHYGNVFVTGDSSGSNSGIDYATVAYSSAGVPLWTHRYDGPGNGDDRAKGIAADGSGNVFVTGYSRGLGGYYDADYATIKFSPTLPPVQLVSEQVNNELVLRWSGTAFGLQCAPDMTGCFTNIPNVTSPYTNLITAPQQFFRLMSN